MVEQDNESVTVAVRIRPLVDSEIGKGCKSIIDVISDLNQVQIADKAFTYNYVFGPESSQEEFYDRCAKNMISNLFKGYNVTILAYGQTGSGKTYTMGTTYTGQGEMGIIPRAVNEIFNFIQDNFVYDFSVTVTFMELYQETLYDLLSNKPKDQCSVEIREDNKGMLIPGLTEEPVDTAYKALEWLKLGSQSRAVGSTNMNTQSSRSHAIFTINICMQRKDDSSQNKTAKFHLVDLAGSERSKKTGATGQTFKEGVNINKGLLALGNVISALGDEKNQGGFISYRDSNLTRLLKDSLGGNSITLMIACVSPADYNLEETLSTLRYADRAKKIKNKPVINQDPKAAEINRLKKIIQQLRLEMVGQGGPILCQAEIESMRKENNQMKVRINELTLQLSSTLNEKTGLLEQLIMLQTANEQLRDKLRDIKEQYNITLNNLNLSLQQNDNNLIQENVLKLESLREQLVDLDAEQKKAEEEVRMHAADIVQSQMFHKNLSNDFQIEQEFKEKHENYAAQQMAKDLELQELSKMLAMKEHLAKQIAINNCYIVDQEALKEMEEKVNTLEKEKEQCLHQLKKVQSNECASKSSEVLRKRVQELEKEIQTLRKKASEHTRLMKLKEKDEVKIKQLQSEIQSMKQLKVKLIRDMRQEAEKFRLWKNQREKELFKLKEKDRKLLNQIKVMESLHSRQQNVLKRKFEEVAASNKRLKDALALRNAIQQQKKTSKIEQVGEWLQQEFNVFVSIIDAKKTLEGVLEDRATLYQQMEELKQNGFEEDSPEIKNLETEIELRSLQIQDLQQKLLDSEEDSKSKTRFDNVQTMAEAKYCLKMLFDITAEIKKKEANTEFKLLELKDNLEEVVRKNKELELLISKNEQQHQIEMGCVQKEYEEKISVLLRQIHGIKGTDTEKEANECLNIQKQQLESLERQLEDKVIEIERLTKQNAELSKTIEDIKVGEKRRPVSVKTSKIKIETLEQGNLNSTYTKPGEDEDKQFIVKRPTDSIKTKIKAEQGDSNPTYIEDGEEDDLKVMDDFLHISIESDNTDDDPDWRKTPLAKRLRKTRRSPTFTKQAIKRSSEGGCTCKGACKTRNCGCKRFDKNCNDKCKCSSDTCINRTKSIKQEDSSEDELFKRPRVPLEDENFLTVAVPSSRKLKSKNLFTLESNL